MVDRRVDWVDWHSPYSDPESPLSRRLEIIQTHIRTILLDRLNFPTQIISLCAGQGRDLFDVFEQLPEQRSLQALLIENDPENVRVASEKAHKLGLVNVAVLRADAGNSSTYVDATPADLVLLCGVFGNISDQDIFQIVEFMPQVCASSATVIWTRSRRHPDITPDIRRSFEANGFEELSFDAPDGELFSVGVNRFHGDPMPLTADKQLFTFL